MMNATKTIAAAGFAMMMAVPGLAQDAPTSTAPMTCAEFLKLDSTGMALAIDGLSVSATAGDASGAAAESTEDPAAKTDGGVGSEPATGTGTDNLGTAPEPTTEAPAATTDGVNSGLSAEAQATDENMAEMTGTLNTEELIALTMTACTSQPDMLISDVQTANP